MTILLRYLVDLEKYKCWFFAWSLKKNININTLYKKNNYIFELEYNATQSYSYDILEESVRYIF